ncbi:MAG: ADP-glyceromanno-heptose 6-epimerase [Melioribacteraceae bacterium]|nr:ADP-glyceromanno-heptose 6-epimerase [Melioribacteraceae bacterium]
MIVVTGGAGFIGSAVVSRLNELGHEKIVIVDRLGTSEKWKNLNGLSFSEIFHKDEFYNWLIEERVPFNINAVIHLGACSSTTEKDSDYLVQNNLRYSQELVKYCLPRKARFIYASSAATYGDGSLGYNDNEDELEKLRPLNMYGYSKHLFDIWLKKMKISNKVVGIKYFNVYGPNEFHKADMRSVVHKAFGQILETGKVKLFKSYHEDYGDGEQMRDFVYVKDAVNMTLSFLENLDKNGLYNVGSGKARSWNDLVTSLFNAMNKPVNIEYIDMPEELRGKYQYFTEANLDKIRGVGYSEKTHSLEEGITDYVQNYLMKNMFLGLSK